MDLKYGAGHARGLIDAEETLRNIRMREDLIHRVRKGSAWDVGLAGWFSVAGSVPPAVLETIKAEAARVRAAADVMMVVGIGGSNRGAMAAIRALRGSATPPVRVVCAGDTLSASGLKRAVETIGRESVVLNVIAKDFNTVEPGIAFRVLRAAMMAKYGEGYASRVIVTGSRGPGQLLELAAEHGCRSLEFPASIGGRFSVLSAVGLFPMAVAGIDVACMVEGAAEAESALKGPDIEANPAVRYAVDRNILASKGFTIESLAVFEPDLVPFAKWWVQLFAETEGKTPGAIFPTHFSYSEDLHAVGQYVQQGRRCITETYLGLFRESPEFLVGASGGVRDGFDYLEGRPFDDLNRSVYAAAIEAHSRDGVPCLEISSSALDARTLGGLFYFFMFACALSATLLGVDPFTQDGVEGYKRNLYRMLGKNS